jgi:hypothetical protein
MKKIYKAVLLAALGLGSSTVAQASTDLLLGFNDAAGPTSAQNDYVIDLGMNAATLVADANANGGTYDLSGLFNSGTFSTAFSSDANALNNVNVGVVGGYTISNPKLLYQTVAVAVTPFAISGSEFSAAANITPSILTGEYVSTTGAGWTASVGVNATTLNSQNFPNTIANATGISPLGNINAGVLSLELWGNQRTGTGSPVGWQDQGTFNINLNTDTITFVVPVPEPSTLGLMGVAGLATLVFGRRFTRKND